MSNRFEKLRQHLSSGPKAQALDKGIVDKENKEAELARIDAKIAELESSSHPNSLESLEFWKNAEPNSGLNKGNICYKIYWHV